jgi:hypothetical protein
VLDLTRLFQLRVEPLSPVIVAAAAISVLAVAAAAAFLATRFQQVSAALRRCFDLLRVVESTGCCQSWAVSVQVVPDSPIRRKTKVLAQTGSAFEFSPD